MEVRALADAPARPVRVIDPDTGLVAAARAQPREFLALYDKYFDRVLGYVRIRISDPATCEDVTSQVFTTALERLDRFRGHGSFAGWLFQIARNAARDVHRRRTPEQLDGERLLALGGRRHPGGRDRACARGGGRAGERPSLRCVPAA